MPKSEMSCNYSLPRSNSNHQHNQTEISTWGVGQPPNYSEALRPIQLNTIQPSLPEYHHQHDRETNFDRPPPPLPPTQPLENRRIDTQYVPYGQTHGYLQPNSSLSPKTPSTTRSMTRLSAFHAEAPPKPTHPWIERVRAWVMRLVVEWWLMEIISWSFSAMSMASIIAVLSYYNGRELPQWKLGLTLNAFISVFSGFAKTSLLLPTAECLGQLKWQWFTGEAKPMMDFEYHDAASRGPWGSFLLILRVRGRTLSAIGALIIILALPLDLFFQQVIVYPIIWQDVRPGATIPQSLFFTPPDPIQYLNGSATIGPDPLLTLVTQPFFYSNGTTPDLDAFCPTSNCTFEPFETLAVCSACEDVGDQLEFGCYYGPADWPSNFSSYVGDPSLYPNMTQCGYFLNASSNSRLLMTGYAVDPTTNAPAEALTTRWFPLVDVITKFPYYGGSIRFKDMNNPISDFLVVGNPGGAEAVYRNVTPSAHECYLTWCTQTLESSLIWGNLSQNITSTFINKTRTPYPYTFEEDGTYDYFQNTTLTPPNQHLAPGKHDDLTFGLNNNTALSMSFMMDSVDFSFLTAESAEAEPVYKYNNARMSTTRKLISNPWLPPNNISEHIRRLAEAMTIAIRNTPSLDDGSLSTFPGAAANSKIGVLIRWEWLSLPLALLAFSLIFLLATMVKSSREEREVGIWKTSALAILFNGLGEDVQRSVGPNCRMGEARAKARELRVKLLPE